MFFCGAGEVNGVMGAIYVVGSHLFGRFVRDWRVWVAVAVAAEFECYVKIYVPTQSQWIDWELLRACLQLRATTVTVLLYDTPQAIEGPHFTSVMRTHALFRFKLILGWQ